MTSILTAAITELLPAIAEILYDPYASHLLRSSIILVTGQPFPSAEEGDKLRSKKSRKFKAGQAPLRSITTTEKGKERERMVPRELIEVKAEVLRALDEALGAGTDGASARQAATDGVACIVVQVRWLFAMISAVSHGAHR